MASPDPNPEREQVAAPPPGPRKPLEVESVTTGGNPAQDSERTPLRPSEQVAEIVDPVARQRARDALAKLQLALDEMRRDESTIERPDDHPEQQS